MPEIIHMLIPQADGVAPVCGAPVDASSSTLQAAVTCGPCKDIVRARLAFLEAAIGEPSPAKPSQGQAR